MNWDIEYSYRIPCQVMTIELPDDKIQDILIFDLDNYIGRAIDKKDEIIIASSLTANSTKKAIPSPK